MAKTNKTVFVCNECGYESSKWLGKCPACNSWNTFFEQKIDTVIEKPEKIKKIRNFLSYYLPVTKKILERYDEIENQKLNTAETKKFMGSVEEMIAKIKKAFEEQLSNIYQTEMIDTDAELKVFETMLKSDGFIDNIDFDINKNKEV